MLFKKKGETVIASIREVIATNREAMAKAQEYFEREREKAALQRLKELELEVTRLERVIANVDPEGTYELTEQDLVDFGF